jgi:hypothetical protein
MAKKENKQHTLPKVQRAIVKCLAEEGQKDISEVNDSINGHYKSTNTAVHRLEEEKLIEKVGSKTYKNVSFPRYWLTSQGVFMALTDEETDFKKLTLRIEAQKNKDLSVIKPFIGIFKDVMPELKPMLKDLFVPLFRDYDLDKKITDEHNLALEKIVDNSPEDVKAFFSMFLNVREKVKGTE